MSFTIDKILDKKHRCLGYKCKCGVYKITNITNNKIYIGSSKNILQRWKNHIRELETNSHKNLFLQSDWNVFGKDSFIFEILEECSIDEQYETEQKYLNELFPFHHSGTGYNILEKSVQRKDTNVKLYTHKKGSLEDYYLVKAKGCKLHLMDGEHCRTTSKERLEEECHALDTCFQIMDYIVEQNGDDDWEWN